MGNVDYIDKNDYTISISVTNLEDIVEQGIESSDVTEQELLDNAELTAQAEIRAYLAPVYKIDDEFALMYNADPDTRNKLVLRCVVNLSLYNLHMTINPRDIPEKVEKAYQHCIDMLNEAKKGGLDFGLTPVDEPDAVAWRTIGSNRKFTSKPFDDSRLYDIN